MRRSVRFGAVVAATVVSVLPSASCSTGEGNGSAAADPMQGVLGDLLASPSAGRQRTLGDDAFEVWVCHVPLDTTAAVYGGLPLRLPLTPAQVTEVVGARVPSYFEQLSHGRYRPVFSAGGEVTISATDQPTACVDAAVAGAGPDTDAVLVVADAEHAADQPGGFGDGGGGCPTGGGCTVAASHRWAYVGASDFHPDWGDAPPMDLVQHEIGHTLGWVHSGVDAGGRYLSGLDLMSNSAAPREVDATRRDAPGTLALNLFLAGWLTVDDVHVAADGDEVALAPTADDTGTRLLVLDPGDGLLFTVELMDDEGFSDHLPAPGVAVHEVRIVNGSIAGIVPLVGEPPFTELLQEGARFDVGGWQLTVDAGWTVRVAFEA